MEEKDVQLIQKEITLLDEKQPIVLSRYNISIFDVATVASQKNSLDIKTKNR